MTSRASPVLPCLIALICLCLAPAAAAHEILHAVSGEGALVVQLSYADGSPLAYESYEIAAPGMEAPHQVGRTDARGRIAFVPDRAGSWRIEAWTEDGHGADFRIDVDEGGVLAGVERPLFDRFARPIVGVSLVLGVFGAVSLWTRRRAR